jgi:hypothetical protein
MQGLLSALEELPLPGLLSNMALTYAELLRLLSLLDSEDEMSSAGLSLLESEEQNGASDDRANVEKSIAVRGDDGSPQFHDVGASPDDGSAPPPTCDDESGLDDQHVIIVLNIVGPSTELESLERLFTSMFLLLLLPLDEDQLGHMH